ncbi:hypothetical protein TWF970_004794 [Orbilia oligospora]|uniref:Uncharacterized protein n=1 Tax=Orbilia oligospora TaxID=2813651 RepID=A0A7C8VDT0_ORBOL|nr:hypothetical protein TWF970_004794 [Orbilia oligospora]
MSRSYMLACYPWVEREIGCTNLKHSRRRGRNFDSNEHRLLDPSWSMELPVYSPLSSSITLGRRAVVDKRNIVSRTPQDTTSPPLSTSIRGLSFKSHNVKFINGSL